MITKPGIYSDVSFSDYKAIKAVSNSYLGRLDKCPAKALIEEEDTPSMLLGRAVHKSVLEGDEAFFAEYMKAPKVDKRTKEGKAEWASFQAKHGGLNLLTAEDYNKVLAVNEAVYSHPFAAKLLAENVTEQTILWLDKDTGLLCKARPDAVPDEGKMSLIDLKTTSDASFEGFTRSIAKYGYARQAAFYTDGYRQATGANIDSFWFIAVETEAPYRTEVYYLDSDFIAWGREKYKALLAIEKKCAGQKSYPHYKHDFETIFKPAYLY